MLVEVGGEGLVKGEQVRDRQNVMEEWKCVGGRHEPTSLK